MSRQRPRLTVTFTLFPMLDILSNLVGVLILVITGTAIVAINQPSQTFTFSAPSSTEKAPRFVECRRDGVLIHPERTAVPLARLNAWDSPYVQLLSWLSQGEGRRYYLVLLVRPDGIDTFDAARKKALEVVGSEMGYEPVYQSGDVRVQQEPAGAQP